MWIKLDKENNQITIKQNKKEYKVTIENNKFYHIENSDYGKLYVNGKEV